MAKIKFYDLKGKKSVSVDESKVTYVTKKSKHGKVKMAHTKGPSGSEMWRIIGRA